MRILVTGGSGLVGKSLCRALDCLDLPYLAPSSKALDLTDLEKTKVYFLENKPEFIFHLAGYVGSIDENIQSPLRFYARNTRIALNVIEAALMAECQQMINLSSACVYPHTQSVLSEKDLLQGPLDRSRESYALSKLDMLLACKYASQEYGVAYKSVISCNLYGPGDRFSINRSHFMPSIIYKIHQALEQNQKTVEIWGDGLARRELMYVDDLVAFLLLAKASISTLPDYINVGVGEDNTINEFYEKTAAILNYQGQFTHNKEKPNGVMQRLLNSDQARSLAWEPKIKLEQGIKLTYLQSIKGNIHGHV